MIVAITDALVNELLGDRRGQLMAVLKRDHVQHHVDRRGAAGTGEAVAVDLEQLRGHLDVGKILSEAGNVLPMDGAAVAVEQPGAGQDMAARAKRADIGTLAVEAPQSCEQEAILMEMALDPAAQDRGAIARRLLDIAMGMQHDAVAGGDRFALAGEQPPAIKILARRAIGQPQRLDRRGKSDHGEIRYQDEGDPLGQFRGSGAEHRLLFSGK